MSDYIRARPNVPYGRDLIDRRDEGGWGDSPAAQPAWYRSGVADLVGIALVEDDERRREAALEKLRRAVSALRRTRD
jgi:hypothetical protein